MMLLINIIMLIVLLDVNIHVTKGIWLALPIFLINDVNIHVTEGIWLALPTFLSNDVNIHVTEGIWLALPTFLQGSWKPADFHQNLFSWLFFLSSSFLDLLQVKRLCTIIVRGKRVWLTRLGFAMASPPPGFHLGFFVWGGRPWCGGSPSCRSMKAFASVFLWELMLY